MDYRPSRMAVVAKHAEAFIKEFFDQNPLSHVGLVMIKDGISHRLTEMGGSPESQIKSLMGKLECSGDSSLQNALELVHGYLEQVPSYGHKEVLILYSALNTCDPGDIMETIEKCKKSKLRCSVIGLVAELFANISVKRLVDPARLRWMRCFHVFVIFSVLIQILLRGNGISFLLAVSFERIAAGACSPTSCYSRICCS
jgi:hypothetical protein